MVNGKIKTLFSDKEKTEGLFPRTKINAISDDNNIGLNAILENMNSEINTKATESFVTNKIAEAQLNGGNGGVDLSGYATKAELSNYADKNHVHNNYLTAIPSEYITETELNDFTYNKTTIDQKIDQTLGEIGDSITVDLSNYYTKQEVESKILEFMGGKKLVYKTQAQYNVLSDTEKNREDIVYNIIDVPDQLVFNANGDLVVTINGVSKTFAPKA